MSVAFSLISGPAARAETQQMSTRTTFKVDQMADACSQVKKNRDQICDVLVHIRQVGNDALEATKEFLNLSKNQYMMLTAANAIASGRIRVRSKLPFTEEVQSTLDIQRNQAMLTLEKAF